MNRSILLFALLITLISNVAKSQNEYISSFGENDFKTIYAINKINDSVYIYYYNYSIARSDGTSTGSYLLLEDSNESILSPFGVVNGKSIFLLDDPVTGYELWSTDGTVAGTHLIVDYFPGNSGILFLGTRIEESAVKDDFLYFKRFYSDEVSLMRTDGTASGTEVVIPDIDTLNFLDVNYLSPIYNWNENLYFIKDTIKNGSPIAIIDLDLKTTKEIGFVPDVERLLESKVVNDSVVLLFFQGLATERADLYSFNLISNKLVILTSFSKGINQQGYYINHPLFTSFNGYEYFSGINSANKAQLFKSDGTPQGTKLIQSFVDIVRPVSLHLHNDELYFYGTIGNEGLFKVNKQDVVTQLIVGFDGPGSLKQTLISLGDELMFHADFGGVFNPNSIGSELYSYNLVTNDTNLIWNYNGDESADPAYFIKLSDNSMMYIVRDEETFGTSLWKYTQTPVSYSEKLEKDFIKIFPNPVSETFEIKFESSYSNTNYKYKITDLLGQVLIMDDINLNFKQKVNVSNLFPGMYYLQVTDALNTYCLPFYKN